MKSVLVALLLCVALSTVTGLETFDTENIEAENDRALDTGNEVEVVTSGGRHHGDEDEGPVLKSPCQPCWDQGANMCKIHEKTINDNQEVESTIQCMKGKQKLSENSSKKPNPYPGVEFERTLFHGHIVFSREPAAHDPEPQ